MNKTILKTSIVSVTAMSLFMIGAAVASADTYTGNLSTGIGATNGTTVNGVVVAPPTATPTAGEYSSTQNVTLAADGASSINYTTDGTTPTCSSGNVYSGPISVSSSEPIETIACFVDGQGVVYPSTVASYLYAINVPSNTSSGGGGGGGGGGSVSNSVSSGGGNSCPLFSKGDSNCDGKVDILDFIALMANWGKTGSGNPADFNRDGVVNISDFVILMANWTN